MTPAPLHTQHLCLRTPYPTSHAPPISVSAEGGSWRDPLLLGLEGSVLDEAAEGPMLEPAHTITIGVLSSSGGWKAMFDGRTVTATVVPGRASASQVDAAP